MAQQIAIREADSVGELSRPDDITAAAVAEVQGSILMAIKFPRSEADALSRMQGCVLRPSFREKAIYRFPRGDKEISGPSVVFAREFARCWKNLRYGFEVVGATEDRVQLRGFAWDLESNLRASLDASFRPLIFRKHAHGRNQPGWIKPDEREMRELVNRHGAILERNCILKVIPWDLVDDLKTAIADAERRDIKNDVQDARRKVVSAFGALGILASQLALYLGHPISEATPDEVQELREIYASLRDGHSTWSEYVRAKDDAAPTERTAKASDLLQRRVTIGAEAEPKKDAAPSAEPVGVTSHVGFDSVRQAFFAALQFRDEDGVFSPEERNTWDRGSAAEEIWLLLTTSSHPVLEAACKRLDGATTHEALRTEVQALMRELEHDDQSLGLAMAFADETEAARWRGSSPPDDVVELA